MSETVLACDLGYTTLRVGLIGLDGGLVRFGAAPTPMDAGGNEADPAAWWEAFLAVVAGLGGLDSVRGVALTGMTRTQVVVGPDGPLRPAITWRDSRAVLDRTLPDDPETAAVNAFHPAARLLWLHRHEPQVMARAVAVVDPKDELARRLTGRVASDRVSAARLMASGRLLGLLGLPGLLPDIVEPADVLAPVRAGLPGALAGLAGLPVVLAGHDSWACALGLGAMRDGVAYNISGTSEVFGVMSRQIAAAEGLVSADWGGGLHQLGGPSASGGGTLAWAMGILAPDEAVGSAMERLLAQGGGRTPLLFLPHLAGERAPYWDADLRGAFLGLSAEHTASDMAFAVAESVAFLNRAVLGRAEAALGFTVGEIRYGGGGAASPAWAQIKADVTGRVLVVPEAVETGLLGAAIAGWRALGRDTGAMVGIRSVHRPNPARRDRYDRLWALWQQAGAAIRPISHALGRWREG